MKTPVPAIDTLENVIEATLRVVDTHGEDKLNLERVAERSGYAKSTLYRFWPNKNALLKALSDREMTKFSNSVVAGLKDYQPKSIEDVEHGVRFIVRCYASMFSQRPWLRRLIVKTFMASGLPEDVLKHYDLVGYSTLHYLISNSSPWVRSLSRPQIFILVRAIMANVRTWHMFDYVKQNIPSLEDELVTFIMSQLRAPDLKHLVAVKES